MDKTKNITRLVGHLPERDVLDRLIRIHGVTVLDKHPRRKMYFGHARAADSCSIKTMLSEIDDYWLVISIIERLTIDEGQAVATTESLKQK